MRKLEKVRTVSVWFTVFYLSAMCLRLNVALAGDSEEWVLGDHQHIEETMPKHTYILLVFPKIACAPKQSGPYCSIVVRELVHRGRYERIPELKPFNSEIHAILH